MTCSRAAFAWPISPAIELGVPGRVGGLFRGQTPAWAQALLASYAVAVMVKVVGVGPEDSDRPPDVVRTVAGAASAGVESEGAG